MQVELIPKCFGPADCIGKGWAGLVVFPIPDLIKAEAGDAGDGLLEVVGDVGDVGFYGFDVFGELVCV